MASLNTLRTKFGVALSAIIAFALLAFILSLRNDMGFSGNDPKVGEIDGDKIKYSEYVAEYNRIQENNGSEASNDEQADMLASATWQSLLASHVLEPGFDNMGITVTDAERLGMLKGEHLSTVYYNLFTDPRTGVYDVEGIADFLYRAESDPRLQQAWNYIAGQARLQRLVEKYTGLVRCGVYVNDLEVGRGVAAANKSFSGRVVSQKYTSIPDSVITVSKAEIEKYYKEHKNMFRQTPYRSISYVVFDVEPTQEDMAAIESEVRAAAADFTVSTDLRKFVRENRHGIISNNYLNAANLDAEEVVAFDKGEAYGPVLKGNEWTMSRVVDVKRTADSLALSHIVLSRADEAVADSLFNVLRRGGDFAAAAAQYSLDNQTAGMGGVLGVLPFSAFTGEYIAELSGASAGDVVKIASGDMIQLIKVTRTVGRSPHYLVATVTYPVEASQATKLAAYNEAGRFLSLASESSFADAVKECAVSSRNANLSQGERQLRGLEDSREIARWIYEAKKGDLSEIFTCDGDYVVCIMNGVDKKNFKSLAQVEEQVRMAVVREKKFERIAAAVAGADLNAAAETMGSEPVEFSGVNFGSYYMNGIGFEPAVAGAVSAVTETGVVSAPVKGNIGVFVFVVDEIADTEKQTAEDERVRAEAMMENLMMQGSFSAIQEMSDMKDLRGKYL